MATTQTPAAIVGAGLSGLFLAYKLHQARREFQLFEARERSGGRILSEHGFDLGPAWFWPGQARMQALVEELGLKITQQYTQGHALFEQGAHIQLMRSPSPMVSYRLRGGMASLVDALMQRLPTDCIQFQHCLRQIQQQDQNVELTFQESEQPVIAKQVVLALPPRLAGENIDLSIPSPALQEWQNTPTWMAGHAKLVFEYAQPFWRDNGFSGEAISHNGPLMEIHDASQQDGKRAALFGFIGLSAAQRQQLGADNLKQLATQQLTRLFGKNAAKPTAVYYQDWSTESETAATADHQPLNYHPAYGLQHTALWDGKLLLCSSETAPEFAGYLEGALAAAERTFKTLLA